MVSRQDSNLQPSGHEPLILPFDQHEFADEMRDELDLWPTQAALDRIAAACQCRHTREGRGGAVNGALEELLDRLRATSSAELGREQ